MLKLPTESFNYLSSFGRITYEIKSRQKYWATHQIKTVNLGLFRFVSFWLWIFSSTEITWNRVFWLNIAKFEVNWCYRYCFNLFNNLRKESELRQYHCRNSTKVGERKIKSRREKIFDFWQWFCRNSFCPYLLPGWVLEVWVCARKTKWWEKKNWQLWQCHYRKWEEKKKVCGNGIAEIGG